jgi:hypothetical protein
MPKYSVLYFAKTDFHLLQGSMINTNFTELSESSVFAHACEISRPKSGKNEFCQLHGPPIK